MAAPDRRPPSLRMNNQRAIWPGEEDPFGSHVRAISCSLPHQILATHDSPPQLSDFGNNFLSKAAKRCTMVSPLRTLTTCSPPGAADAVINNE